MNAILQFRIVPRPTLALLYRQKWLLRRNILGEIYFTRLVAESTLLLLKDRGERCKTILFHFYRRVTITYR